MKLKIALITLISFLFVNCKNDTTTSNKTNQLISKSNDFKSFIKKFKVLTLPLIINPMEIQDVENLTPLTKSDFRFINIHDIEPDLDKIYPYGILSDTLETYKIIYLFPSEIYLPRIATYKKNGEKISDENLSVGDCGSDCGFTCKETIKIYKDLKIYSVDSIQSAECDSLGPKESTLRKYIHFKNGSINKKGKVNISQIIEQNE
ncbi:MAG TPA: hypothetical protein DCM02_02570 [Flavobacterium sp.]|nr:hypothetical protein [Flavobacterium sp.]HAT76156.1 hypothetical protein [Flavobacterium sp.]